MLRGALRVFTQLHRRLMIKGNLGLLPMNHAFMSDCRNTINLLSFIAKIPRDIKVSRCFFFGHAIQAQRLSRSSGQQQAQFQRSSYINLLGSPLTSRPRSSWPGKGCVCCRTIRTQVWPHAHSPWAAGLFVPPRSRLGCREPSSWSDRSSRSSPCTSATRRPTS